MSRLEIKEEPFRGQSCWSLYDDDFLFGRYPSYAQADLVKTKLERDKHIMDLTKAALDDLKDIRSS